MHILSSSWFIVLLTLILLAGTVFVSFFKHAPPPKSPTVQNVNIDGAAVAALWNTQTGHIEQLTFELRNREYRLDDRAQELKEVEERIHNETLELQRFQNKLVSLQNKLDETILIIENEEVKNLRDMAVKYSNMEPDTVIQVFDVMDDIEVVKVLYFMDADAQAAIFSAMIDRKEEDAPALSQRTKDIMPGPNRVAKLNEMLKFTVPPQKKQGSGLF